MKVCSKCKVEKALSEYAKKAGTRDNLQTFCKECDRIRNQTYREMNPEKEKERCRIKNLQHRKVSSREKVKIEHKILETLQPEITEISQSYLNKNTNPMEFKIVKMTPELASSLLSNNDNNRNISQTHVKFIANQMKEGLWQQSNGESIKISKNGKLLDGQHRLQAIINTGMTFEMLIISNLSEDVFVTLDSGKRRSAGDVLSIDKIKNANIVAGAIRLIHIHESGKSFNYGGHLTRTITSQEVLEFEKNNNVSEYSAQAVAWAKKSKILTQSQFLFFHYIFSKIDNEEAYSFLEKLSSGVNLSEKNPIKVLRDRILKHKLSSLNLPANQLYYIVFKSWNYFREGKEISVIPLYNSDSKEIILK